MNKVKILILATEGPTTNILVNAINKECVVVGFILEKKISKAKLLKQRIKKLGLLNVFGQILFLTLLVPLIKVRGRRRKKEILTSYNLNEKIITVPKKIQVSSINSKEAIENIQKIKADLILLSGTRILTKSVLENITIPVVNIHAGITPKFRGVHGGYWALASGNKDLFGVTLHQVDKGIDSGKIIGQTIITINGKDNYYTYPFLQLAYGIKLFYAKINDVLEGESQEFIPLTKESKLWYHPTFFGYLNNLVSKKVK